MSPASKLQAPSRPSVRKPKAPALEPAREEQRPQGALTRQDIALAIANKCESVSKREAKRLVDSVIDEIVTTLTRGENLKLHDFGSFIVRGKRERTGRNPRTGAKVPIEPRQVVIFKASPNMKGVVNGDAATKKRDVLCIVGKTERPGATK
jgi:integration host factor subunit alpha